MNAGAHERAPGLEGAPGGEETVVVTLPASRAYVRLARVMAAAVASLRDLPYDAVEDLRIAVDELCTLVVEVAPAGALLELTYRLDGLQVEVAGGAPSGVAVAPPVPELTRQILGAVTDRYELWVDDGRVGFTLVSARWQA